VIKLPCPIPLVTPRIAKTLTNAALDVEIALALGYTWHSEPSRNLYLWPPDRPPLKGAVEATQEQIDHEVFLTMRPAKMYTENIAWAYVLVEEIRALDRGNPIREAFADAIAPAVTSSSGFLQYFTPRFIAEAFLVAVSSAGQPQ
jgi:RimJ/RimL family protein N-acetyltransferase